MTDRPLFPGCTNPPNAWSHYPSHMEMAVAEAVEALQRNRDESAQARAVLAQAVDWHVRAEQPLPDYLLDGLTVALRLTRVKVESADHDDSLWPLVQTDRDPRRGWSRADRIRLMAALRRLSERERPLDRTTWYAVLCALGWADRKGLRRGLIEATHRGLQHPDGFLSAVRLEARALAEGELLSTQDIAKAVGVDWHAVEAWRDRVDWAEWVEAHRWSAEVTRAAHRRTREFVERERRRGARGSLL